MGLRVDERVRLPEGVAAAVERIGRDDERCVVALRARRVMAWGTPKSGKRRRQVALNPTTVSALRAHRSRQLQERLAAGSAYQDGDLVCCLEDGRPLHPKTFSYYFGRQVRQLGLPKIRLHDLRHTHATLALRPGCTPRVVQERLGHANVSITLDTYSHVDLDMQAIAAARVAAPVIGEQE